MKNVKILLAVMVATVAAPAAMADSLLFDRGLPTANLNDAAGSNRSNVAWAYLSPDSSGENWAVGDDFNLGTAGSYNISDLRVWLIGTDSTAPSVMWSDLTLFGGGTTKGSVNVLSTVSTDGTDPNVTFTKVTYADGSSYQGNSGSPIYIWQVDFKLNWTVDGNATNTFFLGGTPTSTNASLYGGGGVSPFLHASNEALSGSTQEDSDNLLRDIGWTTSPSSLTDFDVWTSDGNGWDKASDINVQVFGTPVPLPASVGVGFSMLAGFGAMFAFRKRLARKARIA